MHLWEAAEATGVFAGASVDFEDGFIHLSSAAQVKETARLYFAGQSDLLLIGVETAALGEALEVGSRRVAAISSRTSTHPLSSQPWTSWSRCRSGPTVPTSSPTWRPGDERFPN